MKDIFLLILILGIQTLSLQLERRKITIGTYSKINSGQSHNADVFGFLFLLFGLVGFGLPLGLPIVLLAHVDPIYFITEELHPIPAEERSTGVLVLTFLLRYILGVPIVADFFRSLIMFMGTPGLVMSAAANSIRLLGMIEGEKVFNFIISSDSWCSPIAATSSTGSPFSY